MTQNQSMNEEELKLKRQQEFLDKARRGVLQFLSEKGGKLNMGELHEYSATKYFISHQKFSELMESFVNECLVEFDWATQDVTITEMGKEFILKQ